jgi:hypothetical protein
MPLGWLDGAAVEPPAAELASGAGHPHRDLLPVNNQPSKVEPGDVGTGNWAARSLQRIVDSGASRQLHQSGTLNETGDVDHEHSRRGLGGTRLRRSADTRVRCRYVGGLRGTGVDGLGRGRCRAQRHDERLGPTAHNQDNRPDKGAKAGGREHGNMAAS